MDYILGGHLISTGKSLLIIFLSLYFISSSARELKPDLFFGVSIVFKTQVYKRPDFKSEVIGYLKKGKRVKVHLKHFKEREILSPLQDQDIDTYEEQQGFYQIIDDYGLIGFVEKKHLNLIYEDFRDHEYHLKANKDEEDLTDYRLSEPISNTYPLSKKNNFKLNFQLRLGPSFLDNYLFPTTIKRERFSHRFGAAISFIKNANFDFEDRIYFGVVLKVLSFQNNFVTSNDAKYLEDHFSFDIGPTLFFDSVQYRNISISHGLEINLEYRSAKIDLTHENKNESRKFIGYTVKPSLVNQISFKNLDKNINFNMGMRVTARPKYELRTGKPSKFSEYWDQPDDGFYEMEAKIYQTYFIGLQVYY